MYICRCEVTARFDRRDVLESLIDEEKISEEEAEEYILSGEQIREYAWLLIESEGCEYGDITIGG